MAISSNATGLRPGVCTSTTRPTTPYTGMLIYETDTGYLRVWDGSAWDYLSQKQDDTVGLGPVGGLVYITQASATSGSTLSIDNCFSSTYSNYRILIDGFQPATAGVALLLRLRSGGSDAQTAEYYWGLSGIYADGSSNNTGNSAQTALNTGVYNSANSIPIGFAAIDVFGPNRTERTYFGIVANLYNSQFGGRSGFGEYNGTNAYTGFTVYPGSGNFTNVRVWVYGYRNS